MNATNITTCPTWCRTDHVQELAAAIKRATSDTAKLRREGHGQTIEPDRTRQHVQTISDTPGATVRVEWYDGEDHDCVPVVFLYGGNEELTAGQARFLAVALGEAAAVLEASA